MPDTGLAERSRAWSRWLVAALVPFAAYFLLLLLCDAHRPADWGASLAVTSRGLVVADLRPGSPAERAGLRTGDILLRADGRVIASRLDWIGFELGMNVDRPIPVAVTRGGGIEELALVVPSERVAFWDSREGLALIAARLVQAITLAAAFLVAWHRMDAPGRLAAWLLAAVAVFTVAPPYRLAALWSGLPLPLALPLWLPYLSAVGVSAVLCSLFGVFPVRQIRGPVAWLALWAPMGLVLAAHARFALDLVGHPEISHPARPEITAILPLTALYVCASLALLVRGYRSLESPLDRRRTRVVVIGSLSAFAIGLPAVLAYWSDSGLQLTSSLFTSPWVTAGTLWLLIFPLSFSYALLRHRLLGVPMILREGVQYALARRALLSVVPLVGLLLAADVLLHRDQAVTSILAGRGWLYLLALGIVGVARVRRRAWLDALDRQFFRQRYDGRVLMQAIAADARRAGSFEQAAGLVSERVSQALQPTVAAVLLRREGENRCRSVAVIPAGCTMPELEDRSRILGLARALSAPFDLAPGSPGGLGDRLPSAEREWLARTGVELVVPIVCDRDSADALLILGPHRSEEAYSQDDIDLLAAVADSLGLVLAATGDSERAGALTECPACGRCYAAAERLCANDRTPLVAGRVPRRLGDRYLVEQRLAAGGMGTVYEAVDTYLGRQVAVKVLRDEMAGRSDAIERFEREARLLASLNHPNIVTIHDAGVLMGAAYLVMERLEGRTLRAVLASRGPVGPGEAILILRPVASALDAAHAHGIVHRDLKPENIFLAQVGSVRVPKLLDFGLARAVSSVPAGFVTRAAELWGTPAYMAPEQAPGETPQPAWDLYALGVLLFELTTGALPEAELPSTLATPVREFFAVALSAHPDRRPGNAKELLDGFEDAVGAAEAGAA